MKLNIVFGIAIISLLTLTISNQFVLGQNANIPRHEHMRMQEKQNERITKAAGCQPGSASSSLSLNNVSTNVHSYGDMWYTQIWKTNYIVPKKQEAGILSSGSIWMAGTDINGQKKVTALMYGLQGQDWWPGPLSTVNTSISPETCLEYDKIWEITKPEVLEFINWKWNPEEYPDYSVPDVIISWPAHGDLSLDQAANLAPWFDGDGDGVYDPLGSAALTSDYPWYDLTGSVGCGPDDPTTLFGDQTLWWIFNDAGNAHTESMGQQIGMEVRGQAFCFATNDELNNMTFYNFEMHNRSTFVLTDTYFAIYAETDVGAYNDDYIGCHVPRGLSYSYNGDAVDGPLSGIEVYGANPPAVGIDYFEGPFQDEDGIDNKVGIGYNEALNGMGYEDSIIDNERYGMRRFIYMNYDGGCSAYNGGPCQDFEFYNLMRGTWRDQTRMIHGGTGHLNPVPPGEIETDFAFPGKTDPLHWGTNGIAPTGINANWTELNARGGAPNPVGDRASVQSSGPFTLSPGEINDITYGVVFARTTTGDPWHSVELLFKADDKAQRLFDNCFQVLEGPHAPEVTFSELNKTLVILLSNPKLSNNYQEKYVKTDPNILIPDSIVIKRNVYYNPEHEFYVKGSENDSAELFEEYPQYRFQGYQIYQARDAAVSISDLGNSELARLAFQTDIKDGVTRLINYEYSEEIGAPVPTLMVEGLDEGIQHSYKVTVDLFATENRLLVNNKTYYYIAIAYGHNNFKSYDPLDANALDGQQKPYIASRQTPYGSIQTQSAIPHLPVSGLKIRSQYGNGPYITRVEGTGNGGNNLNISAAMRDSIVDNLDGFVEEITYIGGSGPVDIKVVDPNNVPNAEFVFKMLDTLNTGNLDSAIWILVKDGIDTVKSIVPISTPYEQIIPEWGLSVNIRQGINPGIEKAEDQNNGFITSSIEFTDNTNAWLSGVADVDAGSPENWVRSGQVIRDDYVSWNVDYPEGLKTTADPLVEMFDPFEKYEGIVDGWFAPYGLAAHHGNDGNDYAIPSGPAARFDALGAEYGDEILPSLSSVDIVITADEDKWSRCYVVETADDEALIENYPYDKAVLTKGGSYKLMPRSDASVGKDGKPDGTGTGKGWFPGYAINVETGERLNIMFGESSWLSGENGDDMIWNPTANSVGDFSYDFGGKHYIYVFKSRGNPELNNASEKKEYMSRYDSCNYIGKLYEQFTKGPYRRAYFRNIMWTGIPIVLDSNELLADSSDVLIKIRVEKPYEPNYTAIVGDKAELPLNDNLPMYTFSTQNLYADIDDKESAESALDFIRAVPNPYYGFAEYEGDGAETKIKITNLPNRCTISIYTIDGVLVRRLDKDDDAFTFLEWDLKNLANIPISSGLYIIHINGYDYGEKVIKWFGAMRPFDFSGL